MGLITGHMNEFNTIIESIDAIDASFTVMKLLSTFVYGIKNLSYLIISFKSNANFSMYVGF